MASEAAGIVKGGPVDDNLTFCASDQALSAKQRSDLALQTEVLELYDHLRMPVFRYLVCLGADPEDAAEILQETFLRVYKHLRAGGVSQNLRGWIFRVAHNIAVNQFKKQRRTRAGVTELNEAALSIVDPSPDAEELMLGGERLRRICAVLKSLSAQERKCVHLRAEGLRYREIAEVLGIGISTVADSLRRAIAKLVGENDV